jgi:hypothetical protein
VVTVTVWEGLVATTLAPAIGAPVELTTIPVIAPVVPAKTALDPAAHAPAKISK